jgi:Fe-Mn family superoxide dismutase
LLDTRIWYALGIAGVAGAGLWWWSRGGSDDAKALPTPNPDQPGNLPVALGLPPLPYPVDALAPAISPKTVRLHHDVHQKGYVDGVNQTIGQLYRVRQESYPDAARRPMRRALADSLAFNLGGAYLHDLYWRSLAPRGRGGQPSPELATQVTRDFGSMDMMVQELNDLGMAMQGSGWAVLAYSPYLGRLVALSVGNHDHRVPPGVVPILPVDVWEHAYYLDRGPDKNAYLERFWPMVNWTEVSRRFAATQRKGAAPRRVAQQAPTPPPRQARQPVPPQPKPPRAPKPPRPPAPPAEAA